MDDNPAHKGTIETSAQNREPTPRAKFRLPPHVANVVLPVVFALIALTAWEVLVRLTKVPEAILPPPSAVLDQIAQHHRLLLKHAVPTTLETLLAFGISIPLGCSFVGRLHLMIWFGFRQMQDRLPVFPVGLVEGVA